MPQTRTLDSRYDVVIRAADRLHGYWEASGDIVERDSNRTVSRVYGQGRTAAAAEEEVAREGERWVAREARVRPRIGAMH